MSTTEAQIRAQLGIPDSAKQVMILGSSAHLDWDWLCTFLDYYSNNHNFGFDIFAVRDIFNNASDYLDENKNNGGVSCTQVQPPKPPPYYYSIAEIGYLQQFATDPAGQFAKLQGVGDRLRIVGGGITSPDNLLPHGETLLRNFLIANAWLLTNFPAPSGLPALPPLRQVWTPDDFGHDSQFPILMEAMGLQGVGFSRIPGDPQQFWTFNGPNQGISGGANMAAWLLVFGDSNKQHFGTDFIWQAADGSTTLAHFMQQGYFQGNNISTGPVTPTERITGYYKTNSPAAPTPYIFVPVANDFSLPEKDLVQYCCDWNAVNFSAKGIYAVAATFDHFIQLVSFHQAQLLRRSSNPDMSTTFPFVPAPYWTGCYGSRPEIKIQHQQATRILLSAELYSVVAGFLSVSGVAGLQDSIAQGWQDLTPSTHHDYITGTAANSVYEIEQLPLLGKAIDLGNSALTPLQQNIAAQVKIAPSPTRIAVTVFNQLGFARSGLVEMEPVSGFTPFAFGNASQLLGPVQISSDGKWLFCIPPTFNVPALGYNTYYITSDTSVNPPAYNPPAAAVKSVDGKTVSMSNKFFSAEANDAVGWGLASFNQIVAGSTSPVLQGPANQAIYLDESNHTMNMYEFATEFGTPLNTTPAPFTVTSVTVLENGPVRARVVVVGNYLIGTPNPQFTREYLIVVDEPFLRMKATSAAPFPYSAFVMFPLSITKNIASMIHGTSYHWDTKPSQPVVNTSRPGGWVPPIFNATHDFVVPAIPGKIFGAIYHSHLPAWAITEDNNSLIGCLLRNPANDKDPDPTDEADPASHTLEYALRVPAGLNDARSAMPQQESLSYSTPLQACEAGASSTASLPMSFSMGSLSQSNAYVTAAKPGTVTGPALGKIIVRVYQPTNQGQQLTLTLPQAPAGQQWQAAGITALETALSADKIKTLNLSVSGNVVTFLAERAITTLAVSLIEN